MQYLNSASNLQPKNQTPYQNNQESASEAPKPISIDLDRAQEMIKIHREANLQNEPSKPNQIHTDTGNQTQEQEKQISKLTSTPSATEVLQSEQQAKNTGENNSQDQDKKTINNNRKSEESDLKEEKQSLAIDRSEEILQAINDLRGPGYQVLYIENSPHLQLLLNLTSYSIISIHWNNNSNTYIAKYLTYDFNKKNPTFEISASDAEVLFNRHKVITKLHHDFDSMLANLETAVNFFLKNKTDLSNQKEFKALTPITTCLGPFGKEEFKPLASIFNEFYKERHSSMSVSFYPQDPTKPDFYLFPRKTFINFATAQALIQKYNTEIAAQNNGKQQLSGSEDSKVAATDPQELEIHSNNFSESPRTPVLQRDPIENNSQEKQESKKDPTVGWTLGIFLFLTTLTAIASDFTAVSVLAQWDVITEGIDTTHLHISDPDLIMGSMFIPSTVFLVLLTYSFFEDFSQDKPLGHSAASFFQPFKESVITPLADALGFGSKNNKGGY